MDPTLKMSMTVAAYVYLMAAGVLVALVVVVVGAVALFGRRKGA